MPYFCGLNGDIASRHNLSHKKVQYYVVVKMAVDSSFGEGFLLDERFNPLYFRAQCSLWSILTHFDDQFADTGL